MVGQGRVDRFHSQPDSVRWALPGLLAGAVTQADKGFD